MTPGSSWESLRALFEAALQQAPAERAAFLRARSGSDDATRREVEALLAAHEQAGDFLEGAAIGAGRTGAARTDAPRLDTGRQLGAFEILGPLGAGGMGEVYRARDTRLDRLVAVKVLSAQGELGSRGRARFEREARAISRLSHPHICTVHDVGVAQIHGQEVPFLVLELLDGDTLSACLARGRLALAQTLRYAADIADALATAHAQGIVHRDLKPSNVMVTASGVKLLDFGLAQLRDPGAASEGATPQTVRDHPLTSAGMVLGTLPYMSPEQVEGRTVDARSDIFSFGALLYEMVTGQRAFAGDSARSAAARILSDDPPAVNQHAPAVPSELAAIVSRCLRKDPGRRYQYIADVKVALEDVLEEYRSAPQPPMVRSSSRWRWAWTLALVPAIVAAGYFSQARQVPPPSPAPRLVALTTLHGAEVSPTLAPDGEEVAFTWSGPNSDHNDIYVQRIDSGTEVRRTFDAAMASSPVWSPDGRWIAYLRGDVPGRSELILVPPLGGPERSLGEILIRQSSIRPPYFSWFPDSSALVVVNSYGPQEPDGLFVILVETKQKRPLTPPPRPTQGDMHPAVSPDGRTVAFRRNSTGLHLLAVSSDFVAEGAPRLLAGTGVGAGHPAWTPDGSEIIYSKAGSLWRMRASDGSPPALVALAGQDAFMPVLSRHGSRTPARLVYVRRTVDPNLWRLDLPALGAAAAAAPVLASSTTKVDSNPQVSPDGTRVAFQSTRSGPIEIWVSDPDGANPVQLTSLGQTGTPRWSPDGQLIAFDSVVEGNWEVYVIPASRGQAQRLTFEASDEAVPSFSRDGQSIYFTSNRSGAFEIYKMPLSGGAATKVTQNGGYVAFESIDRRHVYYTQAANGPSSLWRIPTTAGGNPERVLDGVNERAFVVLAQGIYYIQRQTRRKALVPVGSSDAPGQLKFFDFARMKSTVVADLGDRIAIGLGVSPDGRTIFFTQMDNPSSDLMMIENFR